MKHAQTWLHYNQVTRLPLRHTIKQSRELHSHPCIRIF